MGFQDRDYNQADAWKNAGRGSSPFSSISQYSIITILIAINVIVFVLDAFSPNLGGGTHGLNYYVLALNPDRPWAIWSYLTYGFAHAAIDSSTGFWHIASNMIVLYFLGRPVAMRLGRWEFLRFYLSAIVIAGIGFCVYAWLTGGHNYAVGASGAVSGIVALFVFMYPREKIYLFGVIPMLAWVFGVLVVVSDLVNAFNPNNHVAWQAHLVGFAFGALYHQRRWNLEWLFSGLANWFRRDPAKSSNLNVYHPDAAEEKLKAKADEILAKISREGEASLSRGERKTLSKYSELIRKNS